MNDVYYRHGDYARAEENGYYKESMLTEARFPSPDGDARGDGDARVPVNLMLTHGKIIMACEGGRHEVAVN